MNWNNGVEGSRILADVSWAALNVTQVQPLQSVGDLNAIAFEFDGSLGAATVRFQFYTDAAMTGVLRTSSFSFDCQGTNREAGWSIPVWGPYLQISITPTVAVTGSLIVYSSPVNSYMGETNDMAVLMSGDDRLLPVGTTQVYGKAIAPGWAQFFGECAVASTVMKLYVATAANPAVYEVLSKHTFTNNSNVKAVFLPPRQTRLDIINATAGNQLFSYSLTTKFGLL